VADMNAMNGLAEKYGDKVAILGFPCNQFGHQTNEGNAEFLNTLKHVRPGNGFEVNPQITLFEKSDVNGADALPLFKYLKTSMMIPSGPLGDTKGNGCDDIDALILPRGGFGGTTISLWTPVTRSDIAWNFEKFLVGPDGEPVKRFSRYFPTGDIAADIDALL
jgi:glutathione peroxidase